MIDNRKVSFKSGGLFVLASATLFIGLATPSRADPNYVPRPAYTKRVCVTDARGAIVGPCHDVLYPAVPNAGACTRFYRGWSAGHDTLDDDYMQTACGDFMGIDKFCAAKDAYAAVDYVRDDENKWAGQRRVLICTPKYHSDDVVDQAIHIATGVGEGLLTAAPFVGEAVLAGACLYGQLYACAVLALEVSDQAGVRIPTEVGDAIYIANKAPQCIDGDVVACAYLGARGAKAVGLEIPGIPVLKVIEDQQRCTDGEFAACVRLGKDATDAGGIETGALTGGILNAQACLDGNRDTCLALAKEAIKEHVPLKGVVGATEDAAACDAGDRTACLRLGKQISATALGLSVSTTNFEPFGANTCTSAVMTKGPVGLASAWNDRNATSVSVFPSDGAQFGRPNHPSGRDGGWGDSVLWVAADFNGDGKTDLAGIWNNGGHNTITVRQSSNTPQYTPVVWAPDVGTWLDNQVWLPGDFNGDGRMDIAQVWNEGGRTTFVVYLSDGARFATGVQWSRRDGGWGDEVKWAAGDFNGDGKTDIAAIWNDGGNNTITLRQSTGSAFTIATWATNAGGWQDSTVWVPGDFDGDGRLDLAGIWHEGNATSIAVYPSDGSRFAGWTQWSQRDGGWDDNVKWSSGDYNGDGKTDIAAAWNNGGTNTLTVRQSNGTSFSPVYGRERNWREPSMSAIRNSGGTGFTPVHWRTDAEPWRDTSAWCSGQFPAPLPPSPTELKKDHSALSALFPADPTGASAAAGSDQAIRAETALAPPAPKALGRVQSTTPPDPTKTICDYAKSARARNSPAAPGLEKQCAASMRH